MDSTSKPEEEESFSSLTNSQQSSQKLPSFQIQITPFHRNALVQELPSDLSQGACDLLLFQPRWLVNSGLGPAVSSGGLA